MKKRKSKILLILTICIFLAALIVASYQVFFRKVVFYKPFQIEFKGVSIYEFSKIKCTGFSPFDTKLNFDKNLSAFSFVSNNYSHCREITFEIPVDICKKITEINFIYGNNTEAIQKGKIETQWIQNINKTNTGINYFNLSDIIKPDYSVFGIYFSVLLWGGYIRIIYFALLVIIFIISFYFLYRYKKASLLRIRDKAYHAAFTLAPSIIHKRRNRLLISLFLMILFSIIYFRISNFTGAKFVMNDYLYHSSGVNLAKGFGISRIGSIEPFEEYKFSDYGINLEFNYRFFTRCPGLYFYHSPPGYGLFLGAIYYIGGINPFLAKYIQLLLLIIIASCLPLIGYHSWGAKGFLCGIPASYFFINSYFSFANEIQPQALLFFFCFLMIIIYNRFEKKQSYIILIILGLTASFAILTKISFILFPGLILLHFIYRFIKIRQRKIIYQFLIFLVACVMPILLWSLYASLHHNNGRSDDNFIKKKKFELFESPLLSRDTAFLYPIIRKNPKVNDLSLTINDGGFVDNLNNFNKVGVDLFGRTFFDTGFVFIATQTEKSALFHAHNEFINDGDFSAKWYQSKNSFYNNDNLNDYPSWMRVVNFYLHYPSKIISLPMQKLFKGFGIFPFLTVVMLAFIINTFLSIIKRSMVINSTMKIVLFFIINFILFLPFCLELSRIVYYSEFILCIAAILFYIFAKQQGSFFKIPLSFIFVSLSLILLTILISGNPRFTEIIDFIFILCGIYSIFYLNCKWVFTGITSEKLLSN